MLVQKKRGLQIEVDIEAKWIALNLKKKKKIQNVAILITEGSCKAMGPQWDTLKEPATSLENGLGVFNRA